ncbi:hypothetical protein BDR05DRAFT_340910 [Suillus weaverae]|nr:hypothetical protein BDR05DRAFT_340910 [Suillus weaverae]
MGSCPRQVRAGHISKDLFSPFRFETCQASLLCKRLLFLLFLSAVPSAVLYRPIPMDWRDSMVLCNITQCDILLHTLTLFVSSFLLAPADTLTQFEQEVSQILATTRKHQRKALTAQNTILHRASGYSRAFSIF